MTSPQSPTIHDLRRQGGLYYIGSPYSLYMEGTDKACEDVSRLCSRLMERGLIVFSPIAHGHTITKCGKLDPFDGAFWIKVDEVFLSVCDALIVAELPGWKESEGVTWEIDAASEAGKPVYYINPVTLEVRQ